MSELRWILLVSGILVIAGIYFLRDKKIDLRRLLGSKADDRGLSGRREPSLSGDESLRSFTRMMEGDMKATEEVVHGAGDGAQHKAALDRDYATVQSPAGSNEQGPQMIVVLHVAARGSQRFPGDEVVSALESEGLRFGRFEIFHWQPDKDAEPVFSIASMVEPGSFNLDTISEMTTPGLSLFLVLPGPEDAAESFSQMLITARNLAQRLGGEVLDEQGSSLSNQTAGHIREEIIAFQLRLRALADTHA